jgi:hypothetical protein
MSTLLHIERLILLTQQLHPRVRRSKLWKQAADNAIEAATQADWRDGLYNQGAREGSLEESECKDPVEPTLGDSDLINTLTGLSRKRHSAISESIQDETKIVRFTRSDRSTRT